MENLGEEIINSIDLVEIISEYVPLKKRGKNYLGLCPFHQEKTPSFTVSPEKNLYYCFGCKTGGNVFNFLMAIENIPFKEALNILARRAGFDLKEQAYRRDPEKEAEREQLFSIHELARKFFQYTLFRSRVGTPGREYIKKRGYPLEFARAMGVGMAPPGWDHLFNFLSKKGFNKDILIKSGLVLKSGKKESYYDRFRNRLIFTIHNARGQPIAFGGRTLGNGGNEPKYLNSSDTPIFNKGNNLYGINWAAATMRKTEKAIVMEGYTDILTAHHGGLKNCVASLGTALTREQARLLRRYAANIYIAFDPDIAGQEATKRGLEILRGEGLNVIIVQLPENRDPDTIIKEEGLETFTKYLQQGKTYHVFQLDQVLKKRDLINQSERIETAKECVEILANIDSGIEKGIYVEYVAEKLNMDRGILSVEIDKVSRAKSKNKDKKHIRWNTKDTDSRQTAVLPDLDVEDKIVACLLHEEKRDALFTSINPTDFCNPLHRIIVEKILAGKTINQITLEAEDNVNRLLARLQLLKLDLAPTDLLCEFENYKCLSAKRKLLLELEHQKQDMDLPWVNSKLLRYQYIIEQERELRKEG